MRLDFDTPYMLADVVDGIGWMTFNNPDRHNALRLEMNEAIVVILTEFESRDDVRIVVMKGAGEKAFISGADISEFDDLRASALDRAAYDKKTAAVDLAFSKLSKPLIAMIGGYCMGWGVATALQADLRIASSGSQYAIPAARLGVGYAFAGVDKLVSVVGPTKAAEILLTTRRFSAHEALEMGLVNQVVSPDQLQATVFDLAHKMVTYAPLTLRAAKAAIRETFVAPHLRNLGRIEEMIELCFNSADYQEGRQAFMQRRPPSFEGK